METLLSSGDKKTRKKAQKQLLKAEKKLRKKQQQQLTYYDSGSSTLTKNKNQTLPLPSGGTTLQLADLSQGNNTLDSHNVTGNETLSLSNRTNSSNNSSKRHRHSFKFSKKKNTTIATASTVTNASTNNYTVRDSNLQFSLGNTSNNPLPSQGSTTEYSVKKNHWRLKKKYYHRQQSDLNNEKTPSRPIFGVSLPLACKHSKSHDGIAIPAFYRQCIDQLEEKYLGTDSLYRIQGMISKVNSLVKDIDFSRGIAWNSVEPSILAMIIKRFLRELPQQILTNDLAPQFEDAVVTSHSTNGDLSAINILLGALPPENRLLLSWTMVHMGHVIERAKENRMTNLNLSVVMAPVFRMSHKVLRMFFDNYHELFGSIRIEKYVPPLFASGDSSHIELPDTLPMIDLELQKQDSLSNELHEIMSCESGDMELVSQQLWAVTRLISQLKRKRKLLALDDCDQLRIELDKEESRLTRLHQSVSSTSQADDAAQLWEAQTMVTLLSRKLKIAEKKHSKVGKRHSCDTVLAPKRGDEEEPEEEERDKSKDAVEEEIEEMNFTLMKPDSDLESLSNTSRILANDLTGLMPPQESPLETHISSPCQSGVSEEVEPEAEEKEVIPPRPLIQVPEAVPPSERQEFVRYGLLIEELEIVRDDLSFRVNAERREISLLQSQVASLSSAQPLPQPGDDVDEDELAEDDAVLLQDFYQLRAENHNLEKANSDLLTQIEECRSGCIDLKVLLSLKTV